MRVADQTMTINVFNTLRKFIQIKNVEKLKKEDVEELGETPCETYQVSSFSIHPGMRFEALDFSEFTSPKPSLEHAPSLELNPLPPYLKIQPNCLAPEDQDKKTFTCPYGTYAFQRMAFGLYNAPTAFQRCILAIFSDMVEEFLEVFMDDFSVSGETFDSCLRNLARVLKRCEEADLVLNWEKCHFMVNEGTVLGHKISSQCIEVDKAKVEVNENLPSPTNLKGIRSFLGHVGFYRKFIKKFSKISKLLCNLLKQNQPFLFDKECQSAFEELKMKLISAPMVVPLDWTSPIEVMCDASDHAVGATLGQRRGKIFHWYCASDLSSQDRKKFRHDAKFFYWDEPYLFKQYADQVLRQCVPEEEQKDIVYHCHAASCGGHFGGNRTAAKILQSCFYWPTLFKDAYAFSKACDRYQRTGTISRRNEMPLQNDNIPARNDQPRLVKEFTRSSKLKSRALY
ncbi:hypothetical protein GQ457_05G026190 [Hibiscus cannabinus]